MFNEFGNIDLNNILYMILINIYLNLCIWFAYLELKTDTVFKIFILYNIFLKGYFGNYYFQNNGIKLFIIIVCEENLIIVIIEITINFRYLYKYQK